MTNPNRPTVIIGPSGAGKSTLVRELLREIPEAELFRTLTDRERRNENDDDTHIFVTPEVLERMEQEGQLLKRVAAFGHHYGLRPFSNEGTEKILLLRAPFIPEVLQGAPNAAIIQVEAPVTILTDRLQERGDADRAIPEMLEKEILLGRKFAHYIISTDTTFDESYAQFKRVWHEIHARQP